LYFSGRIPFFRGHLDHWANRPAMNHFWKNRKRTRGGIKVNIPAAHRPSQYMPHVPMNDKSAWGKTLTDIDEVRAAAYR